MESANDNELEQRRPGMYAAIQRELPRLMRIIMQGKLSGYSDALDSKAISLEYSREALVDRLSAYEELAKSQAPIRQLHAMATDIFGGDRESGRQYVVLHGIRNEAEKLLVHLVIAETHEKQLDPKSLVSSEQRNARAKVTEAQKRLGNAITSFGGIGQKQADEQVRELVREARSFIQQEMGLGEGVA